MMSQLPIFAINSLYQGQVFGKIGCVLFGVTGGIAGMGAAVNNVAIAYDRYRFDKIIIKNIFFSLFIFSGL
jgi:hypothetical protein